MSKYVLVKHSWEDAPEWANWLAQDGDGTWCWYETKPTPLKNVFYTEGMWEEVTFCITAWEDTLEQRPEITR